MTRDEAIRAYGPFVTREDLEVHGAKLDANTRAIDQLASVVRSLAHTIKQASVPITIVDSKTDP